MAIQLMALFCEKKSGRYIYICIYEQILKAIYIK